MPFSLPPFVTRLVRPSTQSTLLSIAPDSPTATSIPANAQRCTVAAGCFWGVEHLYRKHFASAGLVDAKVGYIGGDLEDPTYRAVCGGKTGRRSLPSSSSLHLNPLLTTTDAEAAQIIFDPTKVSYRQLLEFFYKMHDPTTLNAQGPDTGPQYRSAIYFHDAEQEKVAREVTEKANAQWWKGRVVTEVAPAGKWWSAEEYHQLYLDNNPMGYECPSHYLRPFPPLE